MATTTQVLVLLFCLPSLGLARRKMAGSGKIVANSEDAVDVQQKWDYTTAKTAWDVLCHNRDAGVFGAKWKEADCMAFCHDLKFKCDPDERVENIEVSWNRFFKKAMTISKTAAPVTTDDGMSFKFFIESEGCNSADEDCELPWGAFDKVRQHTEIVDITRRFLVYDARKAGARAVSIETNKYEAKFFRSDVEILGTGAPLPEAPVYAGATGTGCGKALSQCSLPVQGPDAVGETTELDVTTDFIVEDTPGYVSLMKNRNVATTKQTKVTEFEWGN